MVLYIIILLANKGNNNEKNKYITYHTHVFADNRLRNIHPRCAFYRNNKKSCSNVRHER